MIKIPFEIFAAGKIKLDDLWHPVRFTRLNFIDWFAEGDEEKESIGYELWAEYIDFLILINSKDRKRFSGPFLSFCRLMENAKDLTPGERTFIAEALNDETFPGRFESLDKVYDYICVNWSDPENAIDSAESLYIRFMTHSRKCKGGCNRYLSERCFRPAHYECVDCERLRRKLDYLYGAGYPQNKIDRFYRYELLRNKARKTCAIPRGRVADYDCLQESRVYRRKRRVNRSP